MLIYLGAIFCLVGVIPLSIFMMDNLNLMSHAACKAESVFAGVVEGQNDGGNVFFGLNNILALSKAGTSGSAMSSIINMHSNKVNSALSTITIPFLTLTDYTKPVNVFCSPFTVYLPNSTNTYKVLFV